MKKIGFFTILIWCVLVLSASQSTVDPISWQEVYIVNNTDVDLTISGDVTGITYMNKLGAGKRPIHKQTWFAPKKGEEYGGFALLGKLNLLHNISIQPQVYNLSKLPKWMQHPYPIKIADRQPSKVLIIYIGKTANKWLTEQQYVTAVKTVYDEGSAGYRLSIDQP